MTDHFNLDEIESHIKKVESDLLQLLQFITNKNFPDRATMVSQDYFNRLQQYEIIDIMGDSTSSSRTLLEDEPKNTVQFIQSILEHIPVDVQQRERYLKKLLGHFTSISSQDKEVLIQSLLEESTDNIKSAIQEILDVFS